MILPLHSHSRAIVHHPADVSLGGEGDDKLLLPPLAPHATLTLHLHCLLPRVPLLQQGHGAAARRRVLLHSHLQYRALVLALHHFGLDIEHFGDNGVIANVGCFWVILVRVILLCIILVWVILLCVIHVWIILLWVIHVWIILLWVILLWVILLWIIHDCVFLLWVLPV